MKTILVVEDNANMRLMLGTLLEARGFLVTMCADGQSADDISRGDFFDVILVDYYMPGRNGLEVTKMARERHLRTCIIGMSLEDRRKEFLAAGADEFLAKPFDIGDLTRILDLLSCEMANGRVHRPDTQTGMARDNKDKHRAIRGAIRGD